MAIDVLDLHDTGPEFGKAALAALSQTGALPHGLCNSFTPSSVQLVMRRGSSSLARSYETQRSRNDLFFRRWPIRNHGSGEEMVSNLKALRPEPGVIAVVGSVTRADEPIQRPLQGNEAEDSATRLGCVLDSYRANRMEGRESRRAGLQRSSGAAINEHLMAVNPNDDTLR